MEFAGENGYVKCVTCGVVKHYKEMDAGHFISRARTATKITEKNIHPQCKRCNGFLSGNMIAYTTFMIDKYGREFVDDLIVKSKQVMKYTDLELEEITEYLKKEINESESRINGNVIA